MSTNENKWNFCRLYREVICDRLKFLDWCKVNGILPVMRTCPEGHIMKLDENTSCRKGKRMGRFRCRKVHVENGNKDYTMAYTRDTIFQNSKVPPEKLIILTYCFTCHDFNQYDAIREATVISGTSTTSSQTISEWYCYCRELITDYLLNHREYNIKLGGQGDVVEIEEWKFRQRRFIGDLVDEMWALGMVETNSKHFHVVLCPNNKHDPETLFRIIEEHVAPGTTIVIKNAGSYQWLSDNYTFTHEMPECEKDEESDVNNQLQSVLLNERTLKLIAGTHCAVSYGDYMLEYLWRREMKIDNEDAFECFLKIIRCQYPA